MKKNVAGQCISAHILDLEGAPFSGTVTVYVTGDNGSQVIGTTASGVAVSKGNGLYTYSPSAAETNFNHVIFTFVGTGAVSQSPQTYPVNNTLHGIHAIGTLTGTHSATTADLGANAPSTNITSMVLYIPSRGFIRVIDNYDSGTGIVTFDSTDATLTNGDEWILFATPPNSSVSLVPANVVEVNGTGITGSGSEIDPWGPTE